MADIDIILSRLNEIENKISSIHPISQNQPVEIITGEELCRRLNISAPSLIKSRKRGRIPFLLVGKSIRYNWNQVIAHLENKRLTN